MKFKVVEPLKYIEPTIGRAHREGIIEVDSIFDAYRMKTKNDPKLKECLGAPIIDFVSATDNYVDSNDYEFFPIEDEEEQKVQQPTKVTMIPLYPNQYADGRTRIFRCSECGAHVLMPTLMKSNEIDYMYCPYCGKEIM